MYNVFFNLFQENNEPVASNFYPITTAAYIRGPNEDGRVVQLSVLSDRAQGAASLASGELELMVHRRLLMDDGRGVDEALNETVGGISHYPEWRRSGDGITVSGKHVVLLSSERKAMAEVRCAVQEMYFDPVMFVGRNLHLVNSKSKARKASFPDPSHSGVDPVLDVTALISPPVDIISLLKWGRAEYLLRLGHSFGMSEDNQFSRTVEIDLSKLVKPLGITTIEERSLSANQNKEDMVAKRLKWRIDGNNSVPIYAGVGEVSIRGKAKTSGPALIIALRPIQIRTFLLSRETSP